MKIAILGFGTVGSGVYEIVKDNKDVIKNKTGLDITTKYILDIRDFSDRDDAHIFVKDFDTILNDEEVDCVVETIGGLEPAFTFSMNALKKGKTVITSNKELVATKGNELMKCAVENNAKYLFEASVGGGIPIIRPLFHCYTCNNLVSISGILNGTTNYILTKMFKDGESFEKALLQAQQNGYAERDPSADVDGHDTCKKICILSSIASGKSVDFKDIDTVGITKITLEDTKYAAKMGYSIKLIGECIMKSDSKMEIHVAPMFIDKSNMLSSIEDVYNGVVVKGDMVSDTLHYGRGAGKLPTASAVVADIIEFGQHVNVPYMRPWESSDKKVVIDRGEYVRKYYVRIKGDMTNADIAKNININAFEKLYDGELAFITNEISYNQLNDKLNELGLQVLTVIEIKA
jgi:homoserine dehydrogenase